MEWLRGNRLLEKARRPNCCCRGGGGAEGAGVSHTEEKRTSNVDAPPLGYQGTGQLALVSGT